MGREGYKQFQEHEICNFNMHVCMYRVGCFRFNIPERKQNVWKGFYEYLCLQHGPRSNKTARVMTKPSAYEKMKYKYWCSDQMYRFLECGIVFCQMLACGKIKLVIQ